ncbi:hypothetical protein OYT88_16295 [Sporolactobacillus sp. CQH2019]|uniref:M50 family metallopeptidase n=1 Tax=Sporolactobacillus sp. CQH2019 TaxID=3023512 RepID=UPI0023683128|nr:M50 family metallopeptidase [Sporolactobacillus sp. CQH2019]MDD9150103.1 hypothetical protein [Sporolactobacillus sp. CQH2019]
MFNAGLFWTVLQILWLSTTEFISLIGGLVLGGFILGYLERLSNRLIIRTFGMKGIYFTAWLGTPVHELGHAAMCLLFGHRVTGIKLFQANRSDGTIGYVTHTYNPDSLYQNIGNLFIGLAPLISGGLAIFASARFLVPNGSYLIVRYFFAGTQTFSLVDPRTWGDLLFADLDVFRNFFTVENLARPAFWLFIFLAVCISSRMSLSPEDIRGARSGAGAMFLLVVLANVLNAVLDPSLHRQMMIWIGRFNFYLLILLSASVFFSCLMLAVSSLLYGIRNRFKLFG